MALEFIGKDPESKVEGSPTVWVDPVDGSIVLQGWRITDAATLAEIGDVPDHETVLRLPARMAPFLRRAVDGGPIDG